MLLLVCIVFVNAFLVFSCILWCCIGFTSSFPAPQGVLVQVSALSSPRLQLCPVPSPFPAAGPSIEMLRFSMEAQVKMSGFSSVWPPPSSPDRNPLPSSPLLFRTGILFPRPLLFSAAGTDPETLRFLIEIQSKVSGFSSGWPPPLSSSRTRDRIA